MKRLIWTLRAGLCETVFGWAMSLAPADYAPSYIEGMVQFHERGYERGKAAARAVRPPLSAPLDLRIEPSSMLPGYVRYTSEECAGVVRRGASA